MKAGDAFKFGFKVHGSKFGVAVDAVLKIGEVEIEADGLGIRFSWFPLGVNFCGMRVGRKEWWYTAGQGFGHSANQHLLPAK